MSGYRISIVFRREFTQKPIENAEISTASISNNVSVAFLDHLLIMRGKRVISQQFACSSRLFVAGNGISGAGDRIHWSLFSILVPFVSLVERVAPLPPALCCDRRRLRGRPWRDRMQ
jgi:hypothetical protein